MLNAIVTQTPHWVWILLIALIGLGLAQTRTRLVSPRRLLAMPLALLGLGVFSLESAFAAQPASVLAWLAALLVFVAIGLRIPRPAAAVWRAAEQRLQLPGSWLPLAVITAIFVLRYSVNVALAMNPAWRGSAQALLPIAALYGALGGVVLGRAIGLFQITREGGTTIGGNESYRPL